MKYTVLPLALVISMASVAEDGWVAVGQVPAAKPAVQSAKPTYQSSNPAVSTSAVSASSSATTYPAAPSSTPSSNVNPSLQLELLTMVETMQQEIAELRGMVEEQNHKVEILEKQQQQRYLDLDRRMSELFKTPQGVAKPGSVQSGGSSTASSVQANPQSAAMTADDLYSSAMAAIKKKEFASALTQLDSLAKSYPKHALAANAHYWSGEIHLTDGNFDLAIKQFQKVLDNYPKHNKAPDSHYKLAVAYDRSGNSAKAKSILKQVVSQYNGTSASVVRLAERYLKRLESN